MPLRVSCRSVHLVWLKVQPIRVALHRNSNVAIVKTPPAILLDMTSLPFTYLKVPHTRELARRSRALHSCVDTSSVAIRFTILCCPRSVDMTALNGLFLPAGYEPMFAFPSVCCAPLRIQLNSFPERFTTSGSPYCRSGPAHCVKFRGHPP